MTVGCIAAHVAARLEACTARGESAAACTPMLGVSAGLGAASLLRDVPLDEPSSARLLLALAQCVDAAAAAAAADAVAAAAVRAAWTAEGPTPERVEVVFAVHEDDSRDSRYTPQSDDDVLAAACGAVSAALPALVGAAWSRALATAPAASLELTRALLACAGRDEQHTGGGAHELLTRGGTLEEASADAFVSDEVRLASALLLSQFCDTAASATTAEHAPAPATPAAKGAPPRGGYESPLTASRQRVVPLLEEFAAARGVRPPRGVLLPLPPMS